MPYVGNTFYMPDSYYDPPEDKDFKIECPECNKTFWYSDTDDDMCLHCEAKFDPDINYEEPYEPDWDMINKEKDL
jgi:hypothetical protein